MVNTEKRNKRIHQAKAIYSATYTEKHEKEHTLKEHKYHHPTVSMKTPGRLKKKKNYYSQLLSGEPYASEKKKIKIIFEKIVK